jgi:hypothetical protein
MWCWRRMEKISWTDRVNNEIVLHRLKEERNILHTVRRRKANWLGHILRRNCLLKHIIERKIRGTKRRGRRRKQLLTWPEGSKKILEVEGGSSGSHSLENSVWKRLWTCRKTDYYLTWLEYSPNGMSENHVRICTIRESGIDRTFRINSSQSTECSWNNNSKIRIYFFLINKRCSYQLLVQRNSTKWIREN